MIVASVNPQPQQTRPANEMFGDMVPHHQGSALMNETSMVKVHPLTPQPPGPVDISVVPYEGFVQHPYTQSSAQPPPPPPHHPSNQLHDAVVLSSAQHPGQPHGAVMPTYMQQQPIANPSQVQSQDNLLLGHYQQPSHPHHDLVVPAPHQQYSTHPSVMFASHQNAYPQPPEMLPTQQQFVGQPQAAHFHGVLVSPTHQHYGPPDGVVHTGQTFPAHQSPYPMHDPLLSPSPHHAGLMHPAVIVNPQMSSGALTGPPPVPTAGPPPFPGQIHSSVVPAYHNQYPGSIQGTVVPGPPPHQHHNGLVPPHQHATPMHGTVIPPPQHPNALPGGVIGPLHQNPGPLHNTMLPSAPQQHPGSLQGTIVSHQHTSPIHSAAVMPTHHHHQQQQQPAAIFGNLTSHHQHPGSMHPSVLPCPRQHPPSNRLHSNGGSASSRQQYQVNLVLPPPYSTKSNDNDSTGLRPLSSSSSSSSSSSLTIAAATSTKAHDNTGLTATSTTSTTTTSTAGGQQNTKVIDSAVTTLQTTSAQSRFFTTSTTATSVSTDSTGQASSQTVPIKKLGTLASKSNGYVEPRVSHKVSQSSYKDLSTVNDSTSGSNKVHPSTNSNHGPWELRSSYSTSPNSFKSASASSPSSSESIVISTERAVTSCSQRSLPIQSSLIPPRMSLSVNGMLPPTNGMVGKVFGYHHSNGNGSSAGVRAMSPLSSSSSKKDPMTSSTSNSDVDAITTGLEKSRLHDNQFNRQLDNTNGNNRRRYVSESWRRQNSESAAASYSFPKQQQPLWSSTPKDQIKVINIPVEPVKRPVYPLKISKNSYSSAESSNSQPRDTLHLTFFLH